MQSHGNSYIFYEVANSYDLTRTIYYDLSKPQWRLGLGAISLQWGGKIAVSLRVFVYWPLHAVVKYSIFFLLAIRCEKKKKDFGFGSGSGSKFNCAARVGSGRVGSDDLGYGPGSGFSLKPVQTSSVCVCVCVCVCAYIYVYVNIKI